MQTLQVLKKVTKLEIDKELSENEKENSQDEEVEALQAEFAIKNKLQQNCSSGEMSERRKKKEDVE